MAQGSQHSLTADDYRACIKALGLTPVKPSYNGATLHVDRDRAHTSIPDPDGLTPEERYDMINLIKWRMGVTDH